MSFMKSKFTRNLLLVLMMGVCSAIAADAQCRDRAPSNIDELPITRVYFSNGIQTDSLEAELIAQQLCADLQRTLESLRDPIDGFEDELFQFEAAINPTQGIRADLAQVLLQKSEELGLSDEGLNAEVIYSWIVGGLTEEEVEQLVLATGIADDFESVALFLIQPDALQSIAGLLASDLADAMADQRVVESIHRQEYLEDLRSGKRVIVLAHSQGNLFTNKVVSEIKQDFPDYESSIGVIGVASPSATRSIVGTYITALDDEIINLLRSLVFDVALGTIPNHPIGGANVERDAFNHNFIQSYFAAGLPSRTEIVSDLLQLSARLSYPPALPAPPVNDQYLAFDTGNPGVPGDGVSVPPLLSSSGGPPFRHTYKATNRIPFGEDNPSIVVRTFSADPVSSIRVQWGFVEETSCPNGVSGGTLAPPIDGSEINGVRGRVRTFERADVEELAAFVRDTTPELCGGVTVSDMFPDFISLDSSALNFEVDAVSVEVLPVSPLPAAEYVTFVQGDPGIPGDGVTISGRMLGIGVGLFAKWRWFDVNEEIPIGDADGITATVYSSAPIIDVGFNASYGIEGCEIQVGASSIRVITPPEINGVSGASAPGGQGPFSDFSGTTEWVSENFEGCEAVDESQLFITAIMVVFGETDQPLTIDAGSIGLGSGNFPSR